MTKKVVMVGVDMVLTSVPVGEVVTLHTGVVIRGCSGDYQLVDIRKSPQSGYQWHCDSFWAVGGIFLTTLLKSRHFNLPLLYSCRV